MLEKLEEKATENDEGAKRGTRETDRKKIETGTIKYFKMVRDIITV